MGQDIPVRSITVKGMHPCRPTMVPTGIPLAGIGIPRLTGPPKTTLMPGAMRVAMPIATIMAGIMVIMGTISMERSITAVMAMVIIIEVNGEEKH